MGKDFVPLFQTILWIFFAVGLTYYFRKEIRLLRNIFAERLEKGSSLKIGAFEIGELKKEVNSVKKNIADINETVSILFLTTMSEPMFNNLSKINSESFGSYEKGKGLERELYYLRDIGYVEISSIQSIPERGNNLSEYVKITPVGRKFVELRKHFHHEEINKANQ